MFLLFGSITDIVLDLMKYLTFPRLSVYRIIDSLQVGTTKRGRNRTPMHWRIQYWISHEANAKGPANPILPEKILSGPKAGSMGPCTLDRIYYGPRASLIQH